MRCCDNASTHVRSAAESSLATYRHSYSTTHLDGLGVIVARIDQTGPVRNLVTIVETDARGNVTMEADPLGRVV